LSKSVMQFVRSNLPARTN